MFASQGALRGPGLCCATASRLSRPSENQQPCPILAEHPHETVYAENEKVFEHHLLTVRTDLDNFGIADPSAFADKLRKAS